MNEPLIEGCVDSWASAMAAARAGADRLELCASLSIGGTTPSPALYRQVRRGCAGRINVLIRPRFGDFLYSEAEAEEMREEIRIFRNLGADGVVIGALRPDGTLDMENMKRLIDCAGAMEITLHRAFDMTRDPAEALEDAVRLGCRTILTSGQAESALAGREVLRAVFRQAAGRLDIMAGSGVRKEQIRTLYDTAGIRVFHTTGRKGPLDSGMVYRKQGVSMGLPSLSEYELWQTDEAEFRECARIVHGLEGAAE